MPPRDDLELGKVALGEAVGSHFDLTDFYLHQAIYSIRIEPGPNSVTVSFRAKLSTPASIVIWSKVSGDPKADLKRKGSIVALRVSEPGHVFKERLTGFLTPPRLQQDTQYWLSIEVHDRAKDGAPPPVISVTRAFRTYRRSVDVIPGLLTVIKDGDKIWNGEARFALRFFDDQTKLPLTEGRYLPAGGSDTASVDDGDAFALPFGAVLHVDNVPDRLGLYLVGAEDDSPDAFIDFITLAGITLSVDLLPEDVLGQDEGYFSNTSDDESDGAYAGVYSVETLADRPGTFAGALDFTCSTNTFRFRCLGTYSGTVEATPQPVYREPIWLPDGIEAVPSSSSIGIALDRKRVRLFFVAGQQLGAERPNRPMAMLESPPLRDVAIGGYDGHRLKFAARTSEGRVVLGGYDFDKRGFGPLRDVGVVAATPLTYRREEGEELGFTALAQDGTPTLIDPAGRVTKLAPALRGDRLVARRIDGAWQAAVRDPRGRYSILAGGPKGAGRSWRELPPEIGDVFAVLRSSRGEMVALGLGADRQVQAASAASKTCQSLGRFESVFQEREDAAPASSAKARGGKGRARAARPRTRA